MMHAMKNWLEGIDSIWYLLGSFHHEAWKRHGLTKTREQT